MNGSLLPDENLARFLFEKDWSHVDVARRMGSGNRHGVFLLERADRREVLKLHESSVVGRRDSFAHELLMHSFYAKEARQSVPALLAADEGSRAILFEWVEGSSGKPAGNAADAIGRMADFLIQTNEPEVLQRARHGGLPAASEQGLSPTEHWQCAKSRVDALLDLEPKDDLVAAMQAFVRAQVLPFLHEVKPESGPASSPILSPSDFGFHNVIRRADDSLCFIDFEHAGWDDPAKLVADFILQPDAPLSVAMARTFLGAICRGAAFDADLPENVVPLLPIQKAKWTTIILNVFTRESADAGVRSARLDRAKVYWHSPVVVL